jgi:hypothetical protein
MMAFVFLGIFYSILKLVAISDQFIVGGNLDFFGYLSDVWILVNAKEAGML